MRAVGLGHAIFSRLTRRIVVLNLAALVVLVSGILYLNQFRAGLIDARVESLLTQGEIIAGAIAASATVETDSITLDPDKLLDLQAGQSAAPGSTRLDGLDFPINPERVAPILRRLISPTRTRARIYDRDGTLIVDSRHLYPRGQILRFDLPPIAGPASDGSRCGEVQPVALQPRPADVPGSRRRQRPRLCGSGQRAHAQAAQIVRVNDRGELIVSVAVPIQRYRSVHGALLLSTQGGDIDTSSTPSGWRSSACSSSPPASPCSSRSCSPAPSRRRSAASPTRPTACRHGA